MVVLSPPNSLSPPPPNSLSAASRCHRKGTTTSPLSLPNSNSTRRNLLLLASSYSLLNLRQLPFARALEIYELEEDEKRLVRLFQEASPSVVFIKDLQILKPSAKSTTTDFSEDDLDNFKVEGTGSGFLWDNSGHIVTNYHVIEKLAIDQNGFHKCKVYLKDLNGESYSKEGKLIGFDASFDLAVLKVEVEGQKVKAAPIGTSKNLRVGQSCFAVGNPFGYDQTLTTGVISGLKREIPSPNGMQIRGVIQTDASINAGNSGGPLIDSYGHVIGVNTATFTRKGSGISSGVNFAIPIDTVVKTIPYLIVYGTLVNNRF